MENWKDWCRLCGNSDEKHVEIFIKSESEVCPGNMIELINNNFNLLVKENDRLPSSICLKCIDFTLMVEQFKQKTVKVEEMFNELLFKSVEQPTGDCFNVLLKHEMLCPDNDVKEIYDDGDAEEITCQYTKFLKVELLQTSPQQDTFKDTDMNEYAVIKKTEDQSRIQNTFKTNCNDPIPVILESNNKDNTGNIEQHDENVKEDDEYKVGIKSRKCKSKISKETQIIPNDRPKRKINNPPKLTYDDQECQCKICLSIWPSLLILKEHIQAEHSEIETNDAIRVIPKEFKKRRRKIDIVQNDIASKGPFICEECGQLCTTKAMFVEHRASHSSETPYKCPHCPKCFKYYRRMREHMDIHSSGYVCALCGKNLNSKETYKRHMVVHSDEMNFQCNFCSKAFKRAKSLKAHLITHTGLRPFACPWCDKTFTSGSNCRKHKITLHAKELAAIEEKGEVLQKTVLPKLKFL